MPHLTQVFCCCLRLCIYLYMYVFSWMNTFIQLNEWMRRDRNLLFAGLLPRWSQQPGSNIRKQELHPGLPCGWLRPKSLATMWCLPGALPGSWIRNGALGFKPSVQHEISGSLIHCATELASLTQPLALGSSPTCKSIF